MAEGEKVGEEEAEEYESDLDDAPRPVARRRAAASDYEEEDDEGGGSGGRCSPAPSDFDGQGAAELYDHDDDEAYGTEDEEYEDVYEELGAGGVGRGREAEMVTGVVAVVEDEGKCEEEVEATTASAGVKEEEVAAMGGVVETKKGAEPYAVPTIGPFYMHDNRFQDKENCSRGQLFGDKKTWYPKDETVWVHDRFQEINFDDSQKDNVGIMHNIDVGYPKRIKSYDGTKNFDNVLMQSRSYDGTKGYSNHKDETVWLHDQFYEINRHDGQRDNVQSHSYKGNAKCYNNAPNMYQEKASRTYQSHWTTSRISSAQNNRSKHREVSSNEAVGKHSYETSIPTPFNSSRSYHQDPPFSQKDKAEIVKFSKLFSSAVRMAHNSLTPQSYPILRKKTFVPSGEHGNAVDPTEVMPRSALHSVSTSGNYSKYSESHNQGKDLDIDGSANNTNYFTSSPAARPYAKPHNVVYQQRLVQPPILLPRKAFAQIFGQKSSGTNKIQLHQEATLTNSANDGDITSTTPPEPSDSAVLSEVKGHNDMEETEMTFSHDAGDHVLSVSGASGFTLADAGFTGIPAKLPVMLFREPGLPSIDMALPGFADQQIGGCSEMGLVTWLPVLTDANVILETHTPPCISTNLPQLSEPEYPSALPRDHSASKDTISLTSQETPGNELVGHQNRPCRYSKMSFAL